MTCSSPSNLDQQEPSLFFAHPLSIYLVRFNL
ncbi:hypothetical protein CBA19CS11_38030 [Caballeronia novacaledonica]|nr:hypothetical protein CBA19CS11_38030 [Caballeronia novacaledonica]